MGDVAEIGVNVGGVHACVCVLHNKQANTWLQLLHDIQWTP